MNKQTLAFAAASFLALASNVAAETSISAVNGHKINHVDQGSGPAIILIHGLGADHTRWNANIDKLSETNRVIAPDLVGFGRSDKPDMDYSVSMYVDQIAGLMDNLGIENATLVGSSMGGLISMLFAERYPERVERLVLVAPAFVFGLPEAVTADMLASGASPKTIGQMEAYLSRVYANPPTDPEVIEALLAEHRQVNSGGAVASLARSIKSGEPTYSDDRLAALKMATLIVHGTQDGIVPVDASRNLASKLANTSFHEFSGAGHWPQLERADDFNDLIADYLRGEDQTR
ncbi:alpha/beta fold hydrolase [uncultured Roseobacter sp.]|uniref:alpha/beta fold hydrolase n=1 Tax=uncultured Roseobacter sp. TaxID=114847 RepID=UPI00261FE1F5|nr:alpha/beta fold hydrolase [uncultured Roseobacter sp.]